MSDADTGGSNRRRTAFNWAYPYAIAYSVTGCRGSMVEHLRLATGVSFAVSNGPLVFQRPVARMFSGEGLAGVAAGVEDVTLDHGTYLTMLYDVDPDDPANDLHAARLLFAEVVGVLKLALPDWVGDQVFEGPVYLPDRAYSLQSDGPIRLTVRPSPTLDEVASRLELGLAHLSTLPSAERDRFRLMSRWVARAQATRNEVDQFLFCFVALEVFPAHGSSDVAGRVRDLLASRVFPDIHSGTVKERLLLGRITKTREAIVHDGLSRFPPESISTYQAQLRILRAVTHEAMNLLAGREYSGSLDEWVRP